MKALHLRKSSLSQSFDSIINATVKQNQQATIEGRVKSFYSFSFSTKAFRERILRNYNSLIGKK
ncbi:MAG: hypothetical protein N4A46_12120 [Schleiferiaceae bacterium]|jgi:hypothetical protein|nr:hypothetical protein [Schleiferiaceae bacterium]